METTIELVKQELIYLAQERESAASNNHIWALGCDDTESATQNEHYAEENLKLAQLYYNMAKRADELVAQFGSWR